MHTRIVAPALSVVLAAVACTNVLPGNPYDPNTPPDQAAPGALSGVVVLVDETASESDLAVELAAIRVTIEEADGVVVKGDDGAPLQAAITVTGTQGAFTFPRLVPGRYRPVIGEVGKRFVRPPIPAVPVVSGETTEIGALTFTGRGEGSIAGEVSLVGGQGGARTVRLYRLVDGEPLPLRSTTTSTDGTFSFTELGVGTYAVAAEHGGFTPDHRLDVAVGEREGQSMTHEFRAESALRLYPVTAVLRASTGPEVREVDGVRYTKASEIPVEVLAFGGVTEMRVATSNDFIAERAELPFVPYAATTRIALPDREGAIDVYAQFRVRTESGFEFVSPAFSTTVVRDVSSPVIVGASATGLVPASDGVTYVRSQGATVSVSLDATDALSAIHGSWVGETDDGAAPDPATLPFDLVTSPGGLVRLGAAVGLASGRGVKRLHAFVQDRAGNVSAVSTVELVVDDEAPAIGSVVLDGGAAFATSSVVSLELALPAGSDATEMAVSDAAGFAGVTWEPVSSSRAVVLQPGDGVRSVWVKVRDAAGNESTAVEASVTVDTTAPSVPSIVLASGATVTRNTSVGVSLSANGATKVRVSTDGRFDGSSAGETYAATFPTTVVLPAGDGRKSVWAQFADDAGNETQAVVASITLDTAAPAFGAGGVSIDGGADFARSVSVAVRVDGTGATEMAIATDGTVDTETYFPFATTSTVLLPSGDCTSAQPGCKSVCVKLRDAAGNTGDAACDTITLDTAAPSVPILATADSVVNRTAFSFDLAAAPTESFFARYEVFIQGKDTDFVAQANAQSALRFNVVLSTPPSTGLLGTRKSTNLIRIRAVDRAGNVSAESALSVVVDTLAPDVPVLAPVPSVLNADTVQLNFANTNRADLDATFSHYEVSDPLTNEFSPTASLNGLIVTLRPDAMNTIRVRAVDEAGNTSGEATATVREDSTEPTTPEISPVRATVRTSAVEISVTTPSRDNGAAVTTYEVKGGAGLSYRPVEGAGPFLVGLRPDRVNEVCVRGRDDAGNVSLEECAEITEASTIDVVANGIDVGGAGLSGDYVAFSSRGGIYLHDLRGSPPVTLDDTVFLTDLSGNLDRSGAPGPDVGVQQINVRTPRISADARLARVLLAGETRANVVYYTFDPALDLDPMTPARDARAERQFVGGPGDIDGTRVAYFQGPDTVPPGETRESVPGTVRWRSLDPMPPSVPNLADLGVALSSVGVRNCPGTAPRISGDVVVWCEWNDADGDKQADAFEGIVKRRVIGSPTGAETLSTRVAMARSTPFDPPASEFQQPVVSERFIAWVEEPLAAGGAPRLAVLTGGPAAVPFVASNVSYHAALSDPSCGTMQVATMGGISGGRIVFTFLRNDGLTNDVGLFDVPTSEVRCLTNDLPPQSQPLVDGSRVAWRDNSKGETLQMLDLSRVRWLDGSQELVFEPVTSRSVTAWISSRTNPDNPAQKRIALVARRVPIDTVGGPFTSESSVVELSTGALFGGPSEGDPPYAVGGTKVAWIEGTFVAAMNGTAQPLKVRDLAGTTTSTGPNAFPVVAFDPDGTDLAYVDGTGALRVLNTATGAVGGVIDTQGAGTDDKIPTVDIDGPLIVYQKGGRYSRDSTGELYLSRSRGAGTPLGIAGVRGPKVANVRGEYWVAYLKFTDGDGTGSGLVPHVCRLNAAFTACTGETRIGLLPASVRDVMLSRDGIVAWVSDEAGIDEVILWDVAARRRWFATPLDPAAGDRSMPDVAEGRLVWQDGSLGNTDVWEMILPR